MIDPTKTAERQYDAIAQIIEREGFVKDRIVSALRDVIAEEIEADESSIYTGEPAKTWVRPEHPDTPKLEIRDFKAEDILSVVEIEFNTGDPPGADKVGSE